MAHLLALAHRWQREIDAGEVTSQKALAEREGVRAALDQNASFESRLTPPDLTNPRRPR